ncbi:S1-like domain-containing RNA-binding protein [Salipaludibacillus sp. CUR1]|uniref:CvfB family protein n=1 Tax=Salipaludibacillus sp. CUR1 TaxID=2820003 RepID=UPI001E2CAE01|nr:S1-like domain-containing RNA-binding protein [Salipaludibacillus sp. CUR1]MCE7791928.1 S1-like domain-containing RNA-binding protein [Salipaludibacillus sp. CUR1]
MSHLKPGTIVELPVKKDEKTTYILENDVRLPKERGSDALNSGDKVTVFLYEDKKGQLTASSTLPDVSLDSYGWVEVADVVDRLGVFIHIGLPKDVLVSKDDLPLHTSVWPKRGDHLFVRLDHDRRGKLTAKPVTEEIIDQERDRAPKELMNQPASGHVYKAAKIGSFIITEEGYRGFIHHTERKEEPRLGQWVKGRVIAVKEDGTLNISLRPLILESRDEDAELLLTRIKENGGKIPLTDKSSPEDIREILNLSKAAFKRAMGKLLKEKKVTQTDGYTYLVEEQED